MIEVTHLTKAYGAKLAVSDISFSVREGEIVGFLGPNGAGKTTTMNIITGYISATRGRATIGGVDILENPMAAKRQIGYLPEQPPLYLDMTVWEYLNFVYELKGVKTASRSGHLKEMQKLVDIEDVSPRLIKNLSKGYKQRVGLAAALIGDPDVLVLDEPTVGLDPRQIVDIRNLIRRLGKSRTVILSTHILPEVSAVCERVLVISNGVIVADDKPENLTKSATSDTHFTVRVAGPRDKSFQLLRGCAGMKEVRALSEVEPGSCDFLIEGKPDCDIRRAMFAVLAQADHPILKLMPENLTLEDVFIRLTSGDDSAGVGGSDGATARMENSDEGGLH